MSERSASQPHFGAARAGVPTRTIPLAVRTVGEDADQSALHWSPLAAVRGAVDEMFGDLPTDSLDAIRMTAGELAENVIKYGEVADGVPGHISIARMDTEVEIRTTNKLGDADKAADVFDRLRRIAETGDLGAAFVDRMTEIVEDPTQGSTALGLLRVAYEGLFKISASYANATILIVATRSLR